MVTLRVDGVGRSYWIWKMKPPPNNEAWKKRMKKPDFLKVNLFQMLAAGRGKKCVINPKVVVSREH